MNQFGTDDERIGHQRMIDNIRAEQIKNEPEPQHLIRWTDVFAFGHTEPVARYYCCDWHKHHHACQRPQGAKP